MQRRQTLKNRDSNGSRPRRAVVLRASVVLASLALVSALFATQQGRAAASAQAAAVDPNRSFPPEALREDLRVLWDILDEGHAGLDRYTPRDALKWRFDEAANDLSAPLGEDEFYRRLLPLVALIKDGHTRLLRSRPAADGLLASPVYFPFVVRFLGGKAYLYRNLSATRDIEDGSELLAVNGATVAQLLDWILPLLPSDAGIRTRKVRQLEFPAALGELLALILDRPASYRVEVRPRAGGEPRSFDAPAIKGTEIAAVFAERYPDAQRARPLYELDFRGETAVLSIRGFADVPDKSLPPYPEFLKRTFQTLADRKTSKLVIDLRNNGGGRDAYGKLLFAYFADGPFRYYEALEMKKDRYDLFRYTDARAEEVEALPKMLRPNARGWFDVLFHPNLGVQQPQALHFAGAVAVLLNGLSFSATGETASLFHHHRKAVFIGEECGAGYYGNTSGFMGMATLPNTKLRVRIPMVRYAMAVDGYPADQGVVPDIAVEPTIDDLLAGRDPVLDRALEHLEARDK